MADELENNPDKLVQLIEKCINEVMKLIVNLLCGKYPHYSSGKSKRKSPN